MLFQTPAPTKVMIKLKLILKSNYLFKFPSNFSEIIKTTTPVQKAGFNFSLITFRAFHSRQISLGLHIIHSLAALMISWVFILPVACYLSKLFLVHSGFTWKLLRDWGNHLYCIMCIFNHFFWSHLSSTVFLFFLFSTLLHTFLKFVTAVCFFFIFYFLVKEEKMFIVWVHTLN